jgi:phosphatidylinositol alpha-1,6-mannosyltransferase
VIAGTGPERERLGTLAGDLGCAADVIFAGHVSDEELPSLYAAADVFVMPSRALPGRDGIEGFGIVFLEAAACARAAVGARTGGIADAVVDGETGILVDPDDLPALERVLSGLLAAPADAARLGAAARRRAERLEREWTAAAAYAWDAGGRQ